MVYNPRNNQSVFVHKWLSYTADKEEIYIQHARNGGEKREGNYLLDGYHEETHTTFEVHGCFWHGCPRCYTRDTVNPVNGKTMQELHHCTVAKIDYLKRKGYNVVEVWECDVNRELKQNEEMKHYFEHYHMVNPLNPRHAITIVAKETNKSGTWTLPASTPTSTDPKPYRPPGDYYREF